MYAPTSDDRDPDFDIKERVAEINQKWGETPPSDIDGCAWITRVLGADSLRPGPGGVLRSVAGPVVSSQLFEEAVSGSEPCDGRLVGIALELVTGFVDRAAKGLVVAGIVTVAGAEESGPALEWGIKRLLKALAAELKGMLEQHRDLFADAGILAPMAPIATADEILELLATASGDRGMLSLNRRPDRLH